MSDKTIGFIGLGLIGGSIAKALRRVHPEYRLIAYNRSRSSLVEAMSDGTINQATDVIDASFSECDFIFLCMPVSVNIQCLKKLKDLVPDTCVITDVGSVKSTIHEAVRELGMEARFIGGHPMAGSEKTGYASATDRLLENAYYIITPTDIILGQYHGGGKDRTCKRSAPRRDTAQGLYYRGLERLEKAQREKARYAL